MHTLAAYPAHAIFIKTAKGQDEIALRRFGLNNRQRRALIVMDGTKTVSAIRDVIPGNELEEIISLLAEQGFIAAAEVDTRKAPLGHSEKVAAQHAPLSHSPKRPPASRAEAPMLLQDAESIRQVKDFMTTTATTYLGLLSANVIHRIERADGAAQLLTEVGPWHMALRESKHGNRFAGPYLDQVTAALTGKGALLEAIQS